MLEPDHFMSKIGELIFIISIIISFVFMCIVRL